MEPDWQLYLAFFVALFAIVNPVGNLPVFVSSTGDVRPAVQRWLAAMIGGFVAVMLVLFLWCGQSILGFFSVSIPAFRIAGGILLLLMGLHMVRGENRNLTMGVLEDDADAFEAAEKRFKDVLVPVGVPLFVGPGSLSTVILYASKANEDGHAWIDRLWMSGVVVLVSLLVVLVLSLGQQLSRLMGQTMLSIATRLLGLVICAIAVQFMLNGLAEVMPTIFDQAALSAHGGS